jgi:hypothetical protein
MKVRGRWGDQHKLLGNAVSTFELTQRRRFVLEQSRSVDTMATVIDWGDRDDVSRCVESCVGVHLMFENDFVSAPTLLNDHSATIDFDHRTVDTWTGNLDPSHQ